MTDTLTPPRKSRGPRSGARREKRPGAQSVRARPFGGRDLLASYLDPSGVTRHVLMRPGAAGSVLVIDCLAGTHGDRRLVAHLAADEPVGNARLVCREYLSDPHGRWCRPLRPEDLRGDPLAPERASSAAPALERSGAAERSGAEWVAGKGERRGEVYRLRALPARTAIPGLRWCREGLDGHALAVSLRDVVGRLESYEPARALTVRALARHAHDEHLSLSTLRSELERLDASRIVLNRGLREAVLTAAREQGLSLSEIALRCGRHKRDGRGLRGGETSWLARRIGVAPLGGESAPTPWIHSEVLALIARRGLGVCPREVELG